MKLLNNLPFLGFLAFTFSHCATPSKLVPDTKNPNNIDAIEVLDPIVVTPENEGSSDTLQAYRPSSTRVIDILHTKLDVKFDWANQRLNGKAFITLKPYFNNIDSVSLDALNFDIHEVKNFRTNNDLLYRYNGKKITIMLGSTLSRADSVQLYIRYTAKPTERENKGGSAAITSDQGLYFINHDGSNKEKPMQIWTQGETESNSCWFPTIDKPNERCTGEIIMTVPDTMQTLANGILISSTKNSDKTRTDHYAMSKPHAPYLFMMAVGRFAKVQDKWRDIPLAYYVEPEFESYAKNIFPHTPEMLEFFSKKLNYNYPWPSFSQIIVRDYVSGAMENTTAVIFGEFIQKNPREIGDSKMNELIVAHEMFHHWFGDLVTCESWSNLTLNEGFANYSEYLWLEHKYGKDEAEAHRFDEINGYIQSAKFQGHHPLIWFNYEDKEQMFDAHSYNKGGLVLHMLRNYVGDKAFFESLSHYLTNNQYSAVEVHDLRKSFETISGQDLSWFFNQWYLGHGHPVLKVKHTYDFSNKKLTLKVSQNQAKEDGLAVFQFPVKVDIYLENGQKIRNEIWVDERNEEYSFNVPSMPVLVNFDAEKNLLCELEVERDISSSIQLYKKATNLSDKIEAMLAIKDKSEPEVRNLWLEALNDPSWRVKQFAIKQLNFKEDKEALTKLASLSVDPSSNIKIAVAKELRKAEAKEFATQVDNMIKPDAPYSVIIEALKTLKVLEPSLAVSNAENLLKSENNSDVLVAIGDVFSSLQDTSRIGFYTQKWAVIKDSRIGNFGNFLTTALSGLSSSGKMNIARFMQPFALSQSIPANKRLASAKLMKNILDEFLLSKAKTPGLATDKDNYIPELQKAIKEIKEKESDQKLKEIYKEY